MSSRNRSRRFSLNSLVNRQKRSLLFEKLEDRQLLATITWDAGGDGVTWSDPLNWATNVVPGLSDDAVIADQPGNVTINVSSGSYSAKSVQVAESMLITGATLDVTNTLKVDGQLEISLATVKNAHVLPGAGNIRIRITDHTTFNTVTLDANAIVERLGAATHDTNLTLQNGLTLNGILDVGSADNSYRSNVVFSGTQTVGGSGTLALGGNSNNQLIANSITITFGPSLTITGNGGLNGDGTFINNGTITSSYGIGTPSSFVNNGLMDFAFGNITLNGIYNAGQVKSSGTAVININTFTNVGVFQVAGGTVSLNGTSNNQGTMALSDGTLRLFGVTLNNVNGNILVTGANNRLMMEGGGGPKLLGGTITTPAGMPLVLYSPGIFDAVTVNGDVSLIDPPASNKTLDIQNGITLNGKIQIGSIDNSIRCSIRFLGAQTIFGEGTISLGGNVNNYLLNQGGLLTIEPGITLRGTGAINGDPIYLKGTIESSNSLSVQPSTLTSEGTFSAVEGGFLSLSNISAITALGSLSSSTTSTVLVQGSIIGDTTNDTDFKPQGITRFSGGDAITPRRIEAMSQDLGNGVSNAVHPFSYANLTLDAATYVRLVDLSDNSAGAASEAVYADTLIVPTGSTLDLNGLKLYARAVQINGTVINGTIGQVPDGGALSLNLPKPGKIAINGEVDDWQIFGFKDRKLGIIVNPGSGSPYPAVTPQLAWAEVQLLNAGNQVIASAASASSGAIASISDFQLPSSGLYTVRVHAAPGHSSSTGNYNVAAFDVTPHITTLNLDHQVYGDVETPYAIDQWKFSASSGTQIQFLLKQSASSGLKFRLSGPNGFIAFDTATPSFTPITLTESGEYTVTAYGVNGAVGAYSFQAVQVSQANLTLGQTFNGNYVNSGQFQLFRVPVGTPNPMTVTLVNAVNTDKVDVYAKLGSPPTRADYQSHADTSSSGTAKMLVPFAGPGDWYILVYAANVTPGSAFSLQATTPPVQLIAVSPDRYGANSVASLTLKGSGFVTGTTAVLVAGDNTTYSAQSTAVDSFTQITAAFNLNSVPIGSYSVRVNLPNASFHVLPNAFQVEAAGTGKLETELIMPPTLGRHATATLYVEYANTGAASIPAPILIVQSSDLDDSDKPLLTLKQSDLVENFWSPAAQEGSSHAVQIYATGATPGLLLPGERVRVPVYYAGLQQPWDMGDTAIELTVGVHEAGSADPIDWNALKSALQPSWVNPGVWDAVYPTLTSQIGPTWGDYVRMLSDNSVYLGRLGLRVTDAVQLYNFELQQAIGFSPVSTLSSTVDAAMPAPGLALSFGRSYANNIIDRNNVGLFGRGWIAPWQVSLSTNAQGTVTIHESANAFRTFRPDSRRVGAYFSADGDTGVLVKLAGGTYRITETSGQVMEFRTDGKLDFIKDVHGNRITSAYSSGRLSSLTHSSGASLAIGYNAAGLISSITDSAGRITTYGYDAANSFLTSVSSPQGTTTYTYDQSGDLLRRYALLSAQDAGGGVQTFTYDTHGRLNSTYLGNHLQEVTYTYDAAGTVTTTDAASVFSKLFYDHRGLVVRSEDALGNFVNYEYDAGLHMSREVNSLGYSRSYTWCDCGQPKTITDELGHVTTFTLGGPQNKPTAFTDAKGNVTQYGYNSAGDVTSTTYADGTIERTIYDATGNPTSLINRRGQAIAMTYNAAGQMATESFADGSTNTYSYDARGRLSSVNSSLQGVTSFTYDTADRMTAVNYPTGRSLLYQYDGAGRRTQLKDNSTYHVNYIYDSAGRLSQLLDGANGNAVIITYTYNAAGRLSREDKGNNTYSEYAYDPTGRIQNIVHHAPNGSVNSRFDYLYDALGRRTSMSTLDGTWTYTYDLTGQLTRAAFASTNGSIANQDLNYVYDAMGNRLSTTLNGVVTNYTTNALNQYLHAGAATYEYDADGNLIREASPAGNHFYTYDVKNRLVRAVGPTDKLEFEYDAFGNRVGTTVSGQRLQNLIDPTGWGNLVSQYTAAGSNVLSNAIGYNVVATKGASSWSYFDFDALGSTRGVTGAGGNYLNSYVYEPFGGKLFSAESVPNPFQFVGAFGVMSDGAGLSFMRARYYKDSIGRFTSQDPIGVGSKDTNLYTYVRNSPASDTDPLGLNTFSDLAKGIGTVDDLGDLIAVIKNFGQPDKQCELVVNIALGAGLAAAGGAVGVGLAWSVGWGAAAGTVTILGPIGGSAVGTISGLGAGAAIGTAVGTLLGNIDSVTKPITDRLCPPPPPPPPPPKPPGNPGGGGGSGTATSFDPNDKLAIGGFGPQGYIAADSIVPYRINFENDATATAPAQQVTITDQLSTDLDWTTFQFTEFGFGDALGAVPTGSQYYFATEPMTYNGEFFNVLVELSFDPILGQIFTTFTSVDPNTGLPPDVLTGFLPPEDGTGRGMGFFSYDVKVKSGLASGTEIRNIGLISFDQQLLIATNQIDPHDPLAGTDPAKEALVTIDGGAPVSNIASLPATTTSTSINLSWLGAVDNGGSGIAYYDIFVAVDGGAYSLFTTHTASTSAIYVGQFGHSYAFYSLAVDNVGNREAAPAVADAQTSVLGGASPQIVLGGSTGGVTDDQTQAFSWSVTDADGDLDTVSVVVTKGTTTIHTAATASGSFNFDSFGLGTFTITVTADDLGNSTSNGSRSAIVSDDDVSGPIVTLGGSSGTESYGLTQAFDWSTSDVSGLGTVSVQITKNGANVFNSSAASGTFNFDGLGIGVFEISVSATDADSDWTGDSTTNTSNRTVTVTDAAPTGLSLSPANVNENAAIGTTVGSFSTVDSDSGESFTYSFVSGTGSTDNNSFSIVNDELRTSGVFDFETKSSYSVRIRSTDAGGMFIEQPFVVQIANVNDLPILTKNIALNVVEGSTNFITSANLLVSDPDNTALEILYTVTSPPLRGQLETPGGVPISSFTQSDILNNQVRFHDTGVGAGTTSFGFTVSDGGGGPSGTFSITIGSASNVPPLFDDAEYIVPANLGPGTPVAMATAFDGNVGDVLTYTLLPGSAPEVTFDPSTRVFAIAPGVSLINGAAYVLHLRATDTSFTFDDATITITVTSAVDVDFGDAPTSYGTATAKHAISFGPILGTAIDYETSALANSTATGDDTGNTDDEDGLSPTGPLTIGVATTFTISLLNVPGVAYVQTWFDLNGDGDFLDVGEDLTAALQNGGYADADGSLTFSFTPTAKILHDTKGSLIARFRASSLGSLTPSSGALDGEIEDYRFTFTSTDFGDLPLTYGTDYTAHAATGPRIGATRDGETFATVNAAATGDGADEDGVTHDLAVGRSSTITVSVQNLGSGGTAFVQLFVDTDGSNAFDVGDTAFTQVQVTGDGSGNASATFTLTPGNVATLNARVRVSSLGGLVAQGSSTGSSSALDGEMEDHQFTILASDRSDAPTGIVGTGFAYGSAVHTLGGPRLGTSVDAESSAAAAAWQANPAATAAFDNFDDGVTFPTIHTAGTPESLTVSLLGASAATRLDVYADLNADGDFTDANELIFSQTVGAVASVNVPFTPTTAMYRNPAFAMLRFRVSNSTTALSATGTADTGEVEDYKIILGNSFDFGDLPDGSAGSTNYTAVLAASHEATGVTLGARVDAEAAALASAAASGDDSSDDLPASVTNVDDEDGVTWSAAVPGASLTFTVNVQNLPSGHLARVKAWIDWNKDGDFSDTVDGSSELAFNDIATANGSFTFTVLPTVAKTIASGGVLYTRFRIASAAGTAPTSGSLTVSNTVNNGELEDYRINLTAIDFGDLLGSTVDAYDTINTTHGRPSTGNNPRFGATVDTESTITPRITADDDGADEDGVTLSSTFGVGIQSTVTVNVQNVNGTTILSGWFDLNNDGDFADSGEKVLNKNISGNGDNTFVFTPSSAYARFADGIAARFRISTDANSANPTGAALNGEIEDYRFIVQTDGGDAWPVSGSGVFPDGYATSSTGHTAIGPRLGTNRDYDLATTQTVTPPSVTFGSTPTTFLTVTNGVGGLFTGMTVAGTNIPSGTRVTAINTSTDVVTISANTTGASSGSYVFTGSGFGGQSTTLAADYDDARVPVINGPLALTTAGEGAAANVTGTPDDEDGLTLPLLTINSGSVGTIHVQNVGAAGATVKAWADLNGDGDFGDSGEEIVNTTVTTLGTSDVNFNLTPTLALAQNPYLRIRIAEGTSTTLNATGYVGSGEMEDHRLQINADLGDGPVSYGLVGHGLVGTMLGAARDQDSNTTFSNAADGDDNTGATPDDEDSIAGISNAGPTPTVLTAGIPNTVTVNVSNVPGIGAKVFAWIDLDDNKTFSSGEQLAPRAIAPGLTSATFVFTPQFSTLYRNTGGTAFMRVRVVDGQTTTSLTPKGYAGTGEVEDHQLVFAAAKDFGDGVATLAAVSAPKATAPTASNASHTGLGASLGVNVDAEFAERTTGAGDDAAAAATPTDPTQIDDEDGLIGTAGTNFNVYDGLTTTFTLNVQNIAAGRTALVKGWIDLNGNGVFTDTGEDVLNVQRTSNGTFTFVVRPTEAQRDNGGTPFTGASILRVRVQDFSGSTAPTLNSTGDAPRGEVEDHLVYVKPAPEVLVSINDNGTPSNLLDDVLEVKDNVAGGADNDLNFVMVTESSVQKLQITSNVPGSAIFVTNQPGATGSGTSVVKIPLSQITKKVFVNTLGGADKVTLDTSGGDFITPAGWNVQMGTGTDTLDVVGTNTVNTWTFSKASTAPFAETSTLQLGTHGTTSIGGVEIANGGDGNDTFKVTSASATGLTFNGDGGTDTVETVRNANFTLTNVSLALSTGPTFTLGGDIENAKLTGGIGTNTFNLSGWDGATARTATLTTGGGNDVLVKDSTGLGDDDFTLSTTNLTVKEGATTRMTATLAGGFKGANLKTNGTGTSTFNVSDWYQAATLTGSTANDVLKITRNFSTATLTDTEFSSGTTPKMTLSSLEEAVITGGTGTNALKIGNGGTAAQWNGAISFDGLAGNDTLSVSRAVTSFTAVSSQANVGTITIDKVAGGTQTVNLIGTGAEAFSFTADDNANTFDVSGWNGTGAIFAKNGNDKIIVNKSTPASGSYTQADVTLTDTLLTTVTKTDAPGAVALTKTITLASVNDAVINGSAIVNKFSLGSGSSVWTGTATIDAGGGATGDNLVDTIAISRDANFVIGASSVTVGGKLITLQNVDTDGASRDKLDLIGGATANTFSYNEWGGQLSINPGAGLDVLNVTETNTPATFDVDNKLVKITHGAVTHEINVNATSPFETVNITGGTGNDVVNLFGANGTFTGAGTLNLGGGTDTVNTGTTGNQTVTASTLVHNGKTFTLTNVDTLSLGGTTTNNSFTVNGWTGNLSINPGENVGNTDTDVLTLSANLDMVLTDGSLAVASRPTITYPTGSFETALLTGFAGNNTFTLSGWTGKGTVNGGSGTDTLVVSKLANMELGNSLFKYDSTSITLTGIERADLTIAGLTGTDGRFLNAKAFTAGAVTLTGGVGNDVIWGGSGSDTINGAAGDDVLVGNSGADVLTGGTGRDILIGGEFSSIDTLNGNDGDDILIGGRTTYDANKTAQDAFIAAWGTSSVNTYADRITLLRDTGVGGTNQFKLNKANAPNDGAIDQFFGGNQDDWFFADSPGAEVLTDRVVGTETVTDTV